MGELVLFLTITMSMIAGMATTVAIIMVTARKNLLKDLSLQALRKREGFRRKKGDHKAHVLFDISSRMVELTITIVTLIVIGPVLIVAFVIMGVIQKKDIFEKTEIIGKGKKRVRLYRFNTMDYCGNEGKISVAIKRNMRYFALDELPVLINVLKGDIALMGLRRIPYSKKDIIEAHFPEIIEQYNQYRPGLVDLYLFECKLNGASKIENERLQDTRFTNSFFLANRSWRLWSKMIATTIAAAAKVQRN